MEPLSPDLLRTPCDPALFSFETTAELPEPEHAFGQARAVHALRLGLDVPGRGYNAFVLGRSGSGRHDMVQRALAAEAARRPAPPDWCYLYNFADPVRPRLLELPAGQGARLRDEMHAFVGQIAKAIEAAFDSEDYRARVAAIQKASKDRETEPLQALGDKAASQGIVLLRTPQGFVFAPLKDGAPMDPDELDHLGEDDRARLRQGMESLGEELTAIIRQQPRLRREMQAEIRHASREAMALAAGHLIDELKDRFPDLPKVQAFLDEVLHDVIETGESLREQPLVGEEELGRFTGTLSLVRYEVNLLVGHGGEIRAPVVHCDNPTYANLIGRIDQVAHMGTLLTNFTLIKPGALHRANEGFLMLDAVQVLSQPFAWEGLKRVLRNERIAIEPTPQLLGWTGTLPLEPEPLPFRAKVVLFGERRHYYLLQALDPEFDDLFKVAVDFDDVAPRTPQDTLDLVQLLGARARRDGLRPLDRPAAARMVEHAARLSGDAGRLSTHLRPLTDLLRESSALAAQAGRDRVGRAEVCAALDAAEQRLDRVRRELQDAVLHDTLVIATQGAQVGQVNGIAVADLCDFRFGHPVRITATARLGDGEVVDIMRESLLGQPLHSKGVLILTSFIRARYARGLPLCLQASLVFEQTYGAVEGDSASLAETCALLSALAEVPVGQAFAVTGSINQFGQTQAVGGVNEKIEGFFDVCQARGLTGAQCVLIPRANVRHLMLRDTVVDAVRQGMFHVHAVDDVDEAMSLLTGLQAGRVESVGEFADGSINRLVADRLERLSLARQAYSIGRPRPAARAWPHRPPHRGAG